MTEQWFCVFTQARGEMKAAAHLRRQGYEAFCPCFQRQRKHARKTELATYALFPRYIFVRVLKHQPWHPIGTTIGVERLVCCGSDPAIVPLNVIEELRDREAPDGFIRLDYQRGDKLRVGAFDALFDGRGDARIAVLLDLLGRKVRLVLDNDLVTAA